MFTRPTVFILGAGVSVPFGFPTGEDLLRIVTGAISHPFQGTDVSYAKHKVLLETLSSEISPTLVKTFAKKLGDSLTPSIDTWLSQNPEYMAIGKEAIATVINDCEFYVKNHPAEADDWYKWIFRRMLADCKDPKSFTGNAVSFISFNYDRMLEYTLGNAINAFFGNTSLEERERMINEVYQKIVHVHGALSFEGFSRLHQSFGAIHLDSLPNHLGTSRQQRAHAYASKAQELSQGIRIIGEGKTDAYVDSQISNIISGAEKIIFLGFGYDDRNLSVLRMKDKVRNLHYDPAGIHKASPVLGTAYRLAKGQTDDIKAYFGHQIFLGDSHLTCVPFCNEYISRT